MKEENERRTGVSMVEIKVNTAQGLHSILVDEKNTVLQALQAAQIPIQASCNGRGACGKCKIKVQGEDNERLACQTYPTENMVLEVKSKGEQMQVVSDFLGADSNGVHHFANATHEHNNKEEAGKPLYMIAVDLGTTTVVIQLLAFDSTVSEGSKAKVIQTVRNLNPQSIYGADVISRITASNQGARKELASLIGQFLCDGIEQMCENNDMKLDEISDIVIGGNTTMMHLLREYDVNGLGKYPFRPVSLAMEEFPYIQLKQSCSFGIATQSQLATQSQSDAKYQCEQQHKYDTEQQRKHGPNVTLFPGISAFVGGDIVAGLYALDFHKNERINLLVDLGTNGELAIGNRDKLLVTSTAAGPAFEGGNISCGTGSIAGAIKEVTIKRRYVAYQTIDNKPAIGICGTGAIDLLAELWNKGYINKQGSLLEEYRDRGFLVEGRNFASQTEIRFTQEDIRQMQLAKAAIRAGIEVLIETYGADYGQIDHLYLAGGMGFSLNIDKACEIGLLPPALKDKVVIVGNSCLGGIIKYLQQNQYSEVKIELKKMISRTTSIQLAEGDLFAGNYLNYMDFF